jgi:WD40 repeat protein
MVTRLERCAEPHQLRALLSDGLTAEEQAALTGHVERCDRCRGALEAMAAESGWWNDARGLGAEDPPAGAPSTETRGPLESSGPPFSFLEPPGAPGYLGRFGPYDVIEFLGQGGSGLVFKALDPTLHRLVAIKVLAPQVAVSATARKRFLREARAAASISHDHVVTIHAVDEAGGLPYLVMQFIAGKSLQERIDRTGPLELNEILRIGMQAASGLAAAHSQGLIHRDVKPANILLENGIERVKLTDFGLARAVDDASLTQSGVIAGTPQYMAPEQARGESVDPRADLFGLGCVMYAMATGHSPFRARTTMAVLKRVCDETPRPIRESNPEIPPWLAATIDRLLAKEPADRYPSAADVGAELAGYLARSQQAASPAPLTEIGAKPLPRRRRRRLVETAIVIAAGVFVTTEGFGVTHVTDFVATVLRIRTPDGTLVLELDDPDINVKVDGNDVVVTGAGPRELRLTPGLHRMLALKDQGRDEAFITINRGGRRAVRVQLLGPDQPKIAVVEPAAGTANQRKSPRYVTDELSSGGMPAGVSEPLERPAMRKAAGRLPDGEVLTIEAPPRPEPTPRVALTAQGTVFDIAYSADGRYLAATAAQNRLLFYDTTGENPKPADADGQKKDVKESSSPMGDGAPFTFEYVNELVNGLVQIAFSPDGTLFAGVDDWGEIHLWDVASIATGKPHGILEPRLRLPGSRGVSADGVALTRIAFSPDGKLLASGGRDGKVQLWDPRSGHPVLVLPTDTFTSPVASLAFAPSGTILAVSRLPLGQIERSVELWQIQPGNPPSAARVGVLPTDDYRMVVCHVAFSPRTGALFTYGPQRPVVAWNLESRRGVPQAERSVWSLAFSRQRALMAIGKTDGRVTILDVPGMQEKITFRAARARILVALSPDGRSLATAGEDFRVRIWDVPQDAQQPTEPHQSPRPIDDGNLQSARGPFSPAELNKKLLARAVGRLEQARTDVQNAERRGPRSEEPGEAAAAKARVVVARARVAEAEAECDLLQLNVDLFEGRDPGPERRVALLQVFRHAHVRASEAEVVAARAVLAQAKADRQRAAAATASRERLVRNLRELRDKHAVEAVVIEDAGRDLAAARDAERLAEAAVEAAEAHLKLAGEHAASLQDSGGRGPGSQ